MKFLNAIDSVTNKVGLLNRVVDIVVDKILPQKTAFAACGAWCYYPATRVQYSKCVNNKRYRFYQRCDANYEPYGSGCSCLNNCLTYSTEVVSC